MILQVLPLAEGGARLLRVYGESPVLHLPDTLPGPDGPLALTELGDYCFAPALRSQPDGALWYQQQGEAFVPVPLPAEPLHPVCGSFLEQVTLPGTLALVGSCAFYDCRKLHRLTLGAGELRLGSDVFLNCFALEQLVLRAAPEQPTGLGALVANLTEQVSALFWPEGEPQPLAGLWYPAYWEDIEETPAHILLHTFSGQGYHYRQCFRAGQVQMEEYDAIFAQGHDADDPEIVAMLCFDRLRWPWRLEQGPQQAYRDFLSAQGLRVISGCCAARIPPLCRRCWRWNCWMPIPWRRAVRWPAGQRMRRLPHCWRMRSAAAGHLPPSGPDTTLIFKTGCAASCKKQPSLYRIERK